VGVVPATVGARPGTSRAGTPVPLSRIAIESPDQRTDGVPHRRGGGRAHIATATSWSPSAVCARRGACGETPARAGAAATPACATAVAATTVVGRRAGAMGSAAGPARLAGQWRLRAPEL